MEIGLSGDTEDECIDQESFMFSPVEYGQEIHIKWFLIEKIIRFEDETKIAIPLTGYNLGITIHAGSYVNLNSETSRGNCDNGSSGETGFCLNAEVSLGAGGGAVNIPVFLGLSFDNGCPILIGEVGIGGSYSDWVTINSGGGFEIKFFNSISIKDDDACFLRMRRSDQHSSCHSAKTPCQPDFSCDSENPERQIYEIGGALRS